MSHLFDGTVEQHYIPHAMAYSACIGPYNTKKCRTERGIVSEESNKIVEQMIKPPSSEAKNGSAKYSCAAIINYLFIAFYKLKFIIS